jgi:hypothetical protein
MKKVLLALLVIIIAIVGFYWYKFSNAGRGDSGPKQEPIALKKHSDVFNRAVGTAMGAYFDMAAAFVDADTLKVKEHCRKFIQLMDSIPMDELKKDTATIYDLAMYNFNSIKLNAESLVTMQDIQEMRRDFSTVSDNLFPSFLNTINYEGETMYLQNCPMAFGDDIGANWLSKTKETINPYLGKNHPVYKATMLHCGMVKDTIKAR